MTCFGRMSLILLLLFSNCIFSQDTLVLNRIQSEKIFLESNLLLLAERLEVDKAEAQLLQAKLWPNPTVEIEEVNLWARPKQIEIGGEELPDWIGVHSGKYQQFAASIEQLIETAGKRRKRMAMEEVSIEKSKEFFEDLLRNLKLEFRTLLSEAQVLQLKQEVFNKQLRSVQQLTQSFKNQWEQGHVSKSEYVRLKAFEMEIRKEIKELNREVTEVQKELKSLMKIPADVELQIAVEDFRPELDLPLFTLEDLLAEAKKNRPDYKLAGLEEKFSQNLLSYEKSQRIPDLNFNIGYDRGGSILYNFVGFGLSFDLPVFDRNQGNIKSAHIEIQQSQLQREQKELELENEVFSAFRNFQNALTFLNEIDPEYETGLDELLESYTRNFVARNISLLEYLDFFETYLENKEIILDARKEMRDSMEEMNYIIGKNLIE